MMKATDFRREHFEKGRRFSQPDFDAYIQASDRLGKTMYTRYLPCLAGGILLGLLFSQGVGGFAGNMLAVVCIFAGLIVGTAFSGDALLMTAADAAVVFLVCMALYALCHMKTTRVRLRGIGLVWAWLAAAGAVVSLIAAISAGTGGNSGVITYTAQFVVGISALTGYILLLCRRRAGLYVILLGMGVMLGAQALGALAGVLFHANQYLATLISSLLGALNPLFAYLAVRAGDKAVRA